MNIQSIHEQSNLYVLNDRDRYIQLYNIIDAISEVIKTNNNFKVSMIKYQENRINLNYKKTMILLSAIDIGIVNLKDKFDNLYNAYKNHLDAVIEDCKTIIYFGLIFLMEGFNSESPNSFKILEDNFICFRSICPREFEDDFYAKITDYNISIDKLFNAWTNRNEQKDWITKVRYAYMYHKFIKKCNIFIEYFHKFNVLILDKLRTLFDIKIYYKYNDIKRVKEGYDDYFLEQSFDISNEDTNNVYDNKRTIIDISNEDTNDVRDNKRTRISDIY